MLCFEFPRVGPATLDAPVCTDMERTMLEPAVGPEAAEAADSLIKNTGVITNSTFLFQPFNLFEFSGVFELDSGRDSVVPSAIGFAILKPKMKVLKRNLYVLYC